MNHAFRLRLAKMKAEALLREMALDALPVDPFAIAASRDIIVKPKGDTEPGVSGMLLRHGDVFGILYATHVPSEGFQRFSVAHELGHYFLEGHPEHVLGPNGVHASRAGFVSGDPYELEADQFAAGLLMPETQFRKGIDHRAAGLASIEFMAGQCRTSLTATAIRYAELSREAVAVVVSTGPTIDFCRLSETMKSLKQLTWLKKGSPVPEGSATARLNASAERVARAERADGEINIVEWLGGIASVQASEEVVGLGSYGKTLTVLTCPSLEDETFRENDGEDEGELVERWNAQVSQMTNNARARTEAASSGLRRAKLCGFAQGVAKDSGESL